MLNLLNHKNKVREICVYLRSLEQEHGIEIIRAVVIGSRQFGIERPGSDWDIRFIYRDPLAWYFQSNDKVESITKKYLDIDVQGYNMSKTVSSIIKSNGPFYEWMSSPHVIYSSPESWDRLSKEINEFYNPHRLHHFYYKIAKEAKADIDRNGYDLKLMLLWTRALLSIHHLSVYGELEQDMYKLVSDDDQLTKPIKERLLSWIKMRNTMDNPEITHSAYSGVYGELKYRTDEEYKTPKIYDIPLHREPVVLDNIHKNIIMKVVEV